jgi:glucuronoarabinoxylan endo-1,4-beta-xylanase
MVLAAACWTTASGAPVTTVTDSFNPSGTRGYSYSAGQIGSVWSNWFGSAFQSLSWDSATDADSNSSSGALKIVANFPGSGSNQFTVINGFTGISPAVSARQFTAIECDVKFAPGSASYLRNGVPIYGYVELGMATPSFGQLYFGGAYIPVSATGWTHITLPLNPATNPNLLKINNVMVHLWGGTSLSGSSTLWVDNIKFTGSTITDTATVNYETIRQSIDGFGASSAWGSSWSTAEADLFFSTGSNGVGLSLLRSRIAPNGTTVESSIMQMAQARGARIWSTPWSPPPNLKTSNSYNGGSFISSPANYQAYANQLANYVSSMKTNHGVNLHAISIQNEPDLETNYESCLWSATQFHDFVPYLSAALAAKGVGATKIMLPESQHWQFPLAVDTMNDPATAAKVGILGGHNYGSTASPVSQFGSPPPAAIWETEHYFGNNDTITNGLELAAEIHEFMTVAEANAYHYWWLKGSGTGSLAGNSTTNPAKRLYVMGNYSKFVRPGFQRIGITSNTTALITAYRDPASPAYVIVAANPTAWPITQTFNLASCPTATSLDRWVTSSTLSLASQASVNVTAGSFTAELQPFTVTTYVASSATPQLIALKSSDAIGSSSFNAIGNWNDTILPTSTKDYTTAQFVLRTPAAGGNHTFSGHSLTVPQSGFFRFKGANNDRITVQNLTLDGGALENGNSATTFIFDGSLSVNSASILNPGLDPTRTIQIAAPITGTGSLDVGNGGAGNVILSGANDSFTGALNVNGGTILKVASLSNLGGNPGSPNPAKLNLSGGTFQPTASFEINHPNSGVSLGTGGATFSIPSGVALTIANPIIGSGALNKSGTGTLKITGTDSHSGNTSVSAGTLVTSGFSGTGSVTVSSGSFLTGGGTIQGSTSISGSLAPTTDNLTFTAPLLFSSSGKLQWELAGNIAAADRVVATAVTVNSGAKIDLLFNSPGSTTNFLHSFWRSSRTFSLISATAITGSFTLGTVTTDSGGRLAATYGSFVLQQSSTGVNLVWTPIPGFPVVEDPTLTLTQPASDLVSIPDAGLSLRLAASSNSSPGNAVVWSQISGPGTVIFLNAAALDTFVSFPIPGTYVLRSTITNVVGTISRDITVLVASPNSLTLSEGTDGYSHAGTFIRGDNTTMNSGARDQIIVGRNGSPLRGLLSFNIPALPVDAVVDRVTLDLSIAASGSGSLLGTLELHRLLTNFNEGSGDGITASNGAGSGADWTTRTGNALDPWTTAGGLSPTDCDPTNLAIVPGFNPTTTATGSKVTFPSSEALISLVTEEAGKASPAAFLIRAAGDTTGSSTFVRFASDNHASLTQRPQLSIHYKLHEAPGVSAGPSPSAVVGVPSNLTGTLSNSLSSRWSLVSGPGSATFADDSQPVTSVTFKEAGSYLLRLSASNAYGETSATVNVIVQDMAYTLWAQNEFSPTELNNPSISGLSAIAAGDGLTNLMKYALGLPPKAPSIADTTVTRTPSLLQFTFQRPSNRPDLLYSVEYSTTLAPDSWSDSGISLQRISTGDVETWQAEKPISGSLSGYLRLRVSRP